MEKQSGDLDLALAISLQNKYDSERKITPVENTSWKKIGAKGIVDKYWELTDPNPNIHKLFVEYDSMFFWSSLTANGVAVDWSNRMTLCAGVCSYEGRGGFCSIRLSQPLLKLRPRRDLVQTLLHEMIHAYLFVTDNNKNHDGHGPQFLSHMHRINKATGTKISVYHTFHREVNQYRQHWWKCDGPCQNRPPYYGVVMRAMNRPPSPSDLWWHEHQKTCGGNYVKIKEPKGYKNKAIHGASKKASGCKDIRELIRSEERSSTSKIPTSFEDNSRNMSSINVFKGSGFTLGSDHGKEDIDLRTKMLIAAEKRIELRGLGTSCGVKRRNTAQHSSGDSPVKSAKKFHLDDGKTECIIIPDTPISKNEVKNSEDPPSIIIPDDNPGPSDLDNVVVVDESDDSTTACVDPVNLTPLPENWIQNIEDYRTCPVCGIGNIHSTIINTHISLCLEAEELFKIVDEDNL